MLNIVHFNRARVLQDMATTIDEVIIVDDAKFSEPKFPVFLTIIVWDISDHPKSNQSFSIGRQQIRIPYDVCDEASMTEKCFLQMYPFRLIHATPEIINFPMSFTFEFVEHSIIFCLLTCYAVD